VIGGLRVLAVVPARGGSKGLPRKNLLPVGGVPLVARVGDVVRDCASIDRAVVSTDDDEIAEVARGAGLDAPFRRPEDLSGDLIGDVDVLQHALAATEDDDGSRYDVVVMLQPTSPLRTAAQVEAVLQRLVADDLDAVWTVSPTDGKAHPVKQLRLDGGLLAFDHAEGAGVIARQQLAPLWHRNGIAYASAAGRSSRDVCSASARAASSSTGRSRTSMTRSTSSGPSSCSRASAAQRRTIGPDVSPALAPVASVTTRRAR
jgi:CMP-N,N'-diacetyllegionaminic acid synthase